MKRIRFRHIVSGEVVESELIIARTDRGETIPGGHDGEWSTTQEGPRLFALRHTFPASAFEISRLCAMKSRRS